MGKGHLRSANLSEYNLVSAILNGFIDDLFLSGNLLFSMNISTGQCTKLLDAKLRFVKGHQNTAILMTFLNYVTNISPLSACFHLIVKASMWKDYVFG